MSYLAKQILSNKTNRDVDDLGIPIYNRQKKSVLETPQYLVARALLIESQEPGYDNIATSRLHMRQEMICRGQREIEETSANFYSLTRVQYKVETHIQLLFWLELKRRLPHLNPYIYKVGEGLWWDKKTGELIEGSNDDIRQRSNTGNYSDL